jgi:hypothetical protein
MFLHSLCHIELQARAHVRVINPNDEMESYLNIPPFLGGVRLIKNPHLARSSAEKLLHRIPQN